MDINSNPTQKFKDDYIAQHPNYKTILFDLDDTLIDFKDTEKKSLKSIYDQFYKPHIMEQDFLEKYHKVNSNLWSLYEAGHISQKDIKSERFELVGENFQLPIDATTVAHFYENQLSAMAVWLPGARSAVHDLKARYQIGVITNGFSNIQRAKYKKFSIETWCQAYIVSEEVMVSKPDKKIFDITIKTLNASTYSVLMVGDSLSSDFQGASNADIDFCWINPNNMPLPKHLPAPKFIISSVRELVTILSYLK